ncbi:MAG: DUF3047 domain-containing protein, partial [Lentisphaeria bacterium]|nr:DUF3047 domain-containing protein [Lentisphaeria bacterium]
MKRLVLVLLPLLPLLCRAGEEAPGFRWDFRRGDLFGKQWRFYNTLPMVVGTCFSVTRVSGAEDGFALVVEAKNSSGFVITMPRDLDLRQYPYMRWRWRIVRPLGLPDGAAEPDDQAGVIYIADGTNLRHSSLGYRWEHNTPVGAESLIKYRGGLTTVKSICLRNRRTPVGTWVEEERNVLADYRAAFGKTLSVGFAVSIGA